MKKLFCILLVLIVLLSFVGCSSKSTAEETGTITASEEAKTTITHATFEVVCGESWDEILYYRDTVTDVMYIRWQSNNEGGLTVMMDPYTKGPLTYDNWLKYKK